MEIGNLKKHIGKVIHVNRKQYIIVNIEYLEPIQVIYFMLERNHIHKDKHSYTLSYELNVGFPPIINNQLFQSNELLYDMIPYELIHMDKKSNKDLNKEYMNIEKYWFD